MPRKTILVTANFTNLLKVKNAFAGWPAKI